MKGAVRRIRIIQIAGILFFIFLLSVIWAADTGNMPSFIRVLYNFPQGDRVGHILLYGILTFLLTAAFPRTVKFGQRSIPATALVILVFAVIEEVSQRFFANRTFDFVDLACSCGGIVLGGWLATHFNHKVA